MNRYLILEDGTVLKGIAFGYIGDSYGEIVFTSSMTGYLESITDPSYKNQILTFASPTVANYPLKMGLFESDSIQVSGVVARDAHAKLLIDPSWLYFNNLMEEQKVPGIDVVDTRFLVRKIREKGVMRAYIASSPEVPTSFPDPMDQDVVSKVSCREPYHVKGDSKHKVLFIDVGAKKSLLRELSKLADLYVVPYNFNFEKIDYDYDSIFISNGPGDPSHSSLSKVTEFIRKRSDDSHIYGVCLGHQIISLALGGRTVKMKFGHRGSNHAVTDSNRIFITTHNHGYAVDGDSLENTGLIVTQWDINDRSVEMVRHNDKPIFSVQYHPEASPGPRDARWFFEDIKKDLEAR